MSVELGDVRHTPQTETSVAPPKSRARPDMNCIMVKLAARPTFGPHRQSCDDIVGVDAGGGCGWALSPVLFRHSLLGWPMVRLCSATATSTLPTMHWGTYGGQVEEVSESVRDTEYTERMR